MRPLTKTARLLTPLAAVLLLAACGSAEEEDVTYEAGVDDLSGGELIVTEQDGQGIPVELPRTPMTNVPLDAEGNPIAGTTPAPAMAEPAE
ncbi:hypothetical protein M3P36_03505 [Altererythrobacter sp. KTW20L]|uniref:hypothetical protein n=1 Tax=Altererythrobacter sp. KTW20L TaxID=2942210 RepID=UPI0020C025BB|nr:hypothetical protein [Altererythrobacter sp. KTW20L]MCL6250114.1 hypothetical protein [Altererythrobacter sp. KTW20L]